MEDAIGRMERDMASGFQHLLVLSIVARDGPIHGYGLLKRMGQATGLAMWKEGTVYPLLARLESQGLLASSWGSAEAGPRRKDYTVTRTGRAALREGARLWRALRGNLDLLLGSDA